MAIKKEMASIGLDPIDAGTTLGIQSKAVFKDTNLKLGYLIQSNLKFYFQSIIYLVGLVYFIFDLFIQLIHIIISSHV